MEEFLISNISIRTNHVMYTSSWIMCDNLQIYLNRNYSWLIVTRSITQISTWAPSQKDAMKHWKMLGYFRSEPALFLVRENHTTGNDYGVGRLFTKLYTFARITPNTYIQNENWVNLWSHGSRWQYYCNHKEELPSFDCARTEWKHHSHTDSCYSSLRNIVLLGPP